MAGWGWVRTDRWALYDAICVVLGVMLLVAAGLKVHQLATEPSPPPLLHSPSSAAELISLLDSRWFLFGVVEFELFSGVWFLAGLYPRQTRAAAMACFALFAAVSLVKALSGAACCGCFGRVLVNPWYTAMLDVAAVVALVVCRPTREPARRGSAVSMSAVWITWLVLAVPAAALVAHSHTRFAAQRDDAHGDALAVAADPRNWVGKPFALLEYIDIADQLGQNEWLVVLFHHDCPRCLEAIAEYAEQSPGGATQRDSRRFAFVEIPPYAPSSWRSRFLSVSWVVGRVSDSRAWFLETPLTVRLREGKVLAIAAGQGSG